MKKRFISVMLTLSMAAGYLFSVPVVAHAAKFSGGSGTQSDPYLISSAEDMWALSNECNSKLLGLFYEGQYFLLTDDIDLGCSESKPWASIGKGILLAFAGNFDGGGHSITGLYINTNNDKYRNGDGLFGGILKSKITNLNVEGTVISTTSWTGGIVGTSATLGTGDSLLENCSFKGTVRGNNCAGGIAGGFQGEIRNCRNEADVYGGQIGGIAGSCDIVKNCVNTGNIQGRAYVGGVCGGSTGVYNSCNMGNVAGTADHIGGITGVCSYTVDKCYNTGDVKGGWDCGGIAGFFYGGCSIVSCYNTGNVSGSTKIGGMFGRTFYESKVKNCYNSGDVTATGKWAGGLGGSVTAGNSSDDAASRTEFQSYYNIGTVTAEDGYDGLIATTESENIKTGIKNALCLENACDNNKYGKVVTAAQLASASTYSGWTDFNSNWELRAAADRPVLKNPCEAVEISDADELIEFAEEVRKGNSYNRRYVELTADIDLDGYDWIPIGKYDDVDDDSSRPFNGKFNGNGHTISNLICEAVSEPYQALFSYVGENGTVQNLIIDESCSFSGGDHTAAIAGMNAGTIENCKNFADVTGDEYTGGIVGENTKEDGYSGLVTKCYNAGAINSTESEAGGIAGFNFEAEITQCANDGSVTSDVSYAGGIVGQNHTGTVTDCYSTGEILSTRAYSGGVAGQSIGKGAKISNSYSYGRVYSYQLYGGVAGNNTDGSVIQNCYYLEDTARGGINSSDVSGSAQKLTMAQFADESSFPDWDFSNIWDMVDKPCFGELLKLEGSGTEDDPYLINDTLDLLIINIMLNKNEVNYKTHFLMTDDIDLEGDGFKPIGYENEFNGVFDGGGHTIKTDFNFTGLKYDYYFAIFADIRRGTVKNLNVEGDMTTPANSAFIGGIAGYLYDGTIENCSFVGNISKNSYTGSYIGGIAGQAYYSAIQNCSFEGEISANTTVNYAAEGGIAGDATGSRIWNSFASGHIEGGYRVGGIAGYCSGGRSKDIVNCYSTGSVKSNAAGGYASGIVGYLHLPTTYSFSIASTYSTATLSGANKCAVSGNAQPTIVDKCYYLKGIGTGCTGATEMTEEQFASGEVAYLLQSGQSEQIWGQSITGYDTDEYPVFTTDEDKIVHKITCSTKSNANYAAAYGTSEGVSSIPSYSGSGFTGWSLTNPPTSKLLTEDTPITKDITVYASSQELYGEADSDKTIRVDYGKGASVDLSQYIVYQKGTNTKGKYTYTINSGNNTLKATVSGDTLTIPTSAPVGTHTLSVTATEKTPNISLMSVSFDDVPVTMNITVIVAKRDASVTAPKAKTLTYNAAEQELVTAGATNGGTLMYSLDGNTYSQSVPKGTNAGSYTVYYRLDGGTEFNDIAAKTVAVSIAKKKAELTIPQTNAAVYGTKLSAITLPSGWKWSDGQIVPTVKNSGYEAVYTVSDTANYDWSGVSGYNSSSNTVKRTVPVTITKATPVVTPPAGKILKTTGEMQEIIYAGKTTAGTLVYSLDGTNYSAEIPKAKDMGKYTVYYKVIGDDNYNDTEPQTITAELGKADIPEDKITYPRAKTWIGYDGDELDLVVAGKIEGIEGARFLYSLDNKTFSEELPKAVNAGTYMVYYKIDGGDLYNDVPVRVSYASIEKQDVFWYAIAKAAGLYQNFYNQDLTYGIKLSDIKLNDDFEWVDGSIIPEVDYAEQNGYPAIMHTENEDNYDWDGVEGFDREKHIWRTDLPFQMKKADVTDITEPAAKELTYNGNLQELVTRGSAKGGSYVYSLDGKEYSDTVPTGTNAGEYTVYYKVAGDSNHNDTAAKSVKVTVAKKAPQLTLPSNLKTVVYGARLSEISLPGGWSWADGTITPTVNNNGYDAKIAIDYDSNYDWESIEGYNAQTHTVTRTLEVKVNKAKSNEKVPDGLTATYGDKLSDVELPGGWSWDNPDAYVGNAGKHLYAAAYTPEDTDNYEGINTNISIEVNKADPIVTAPEAKDVTYTGLAQEIVTGATTTGGTLMYSLDGDNYFTSVPKARKTGEYTVYYKVEEDGNYNGYDEHTVKATIKKANLNNLAVQMPEWTAGNEAPEPILSGNVSGGTVTYEYKAKDAADSAYSADKPNTDGEFTVRATVTETDNYNSATVNSDFTVREPEGAPIPNTLTYNGGEQELVASENDKFVYSLDGNTFTSAIPKATEAGKYTVYYKIGISGAKTLEATILPAAAKLDTPDSPSQAFDYGTKLSEFTLPAGWSWSDGNAVPVVADSEGYEAKYTVSDNKNYIWTDVEGYDAENNTVTRHITVKVNKVAPSYTPPTANTLTYNGMAQQLVTNGSTNDGSIMYLKEYAVGTYKMSFPSSDTPTGVNAGNYTVKYKVRGDRNHTDTDWLNVDVTIAPATAELSEPTLTSVTYGTKLSDITLPAGWSWEKGDTIPTVNNFGYNALYDTTQGTLDSNHTWEGAEGYNSQTKKITRKLSPIVMKAIPAPEELTDITAIYGNKLSDVKLPSRWSWDNPDTNVGNVGKRLFAAIYTPEDKDNYEDLFTNISVEVRKADPVVTAPEARDVTYNGLVQELVTAAETTGGTILYSVDQANYFTTVPKGRNAGEYTVYYKVEGDGNYNDSAEQNVTANIKKANLNNLSVQMPEWTAGSEAPEPIISGNVGGGAVTYEYKLKDAADSAYSADIPNTDGEFTVRATVSETDNYNSAAVTADFTVREAEGAPIANTLTYNGNEQLLVAAENDKFVYSLDGNNFTSAIPKATEAGKYTVYYKIGTSRAKTLEATILPAAAKLDTPTLTQTEDYGAKLSAFTLDDGWSWKDGNTVPEVINYVGYEAVYAIKDSKNYNWTDVEGYNAADKTVKRHIMVKVNMVAPSYTPPTAKTLTYTGKAQELVTNGSTNDGEILYPIIVNFFGHEMAALTTSAPTGINAGEYTVTYTIRGDRNHYDINDQELKVTIAPAKAEITEPTLTSITYGTKLSDISLPAGWSWENGDTVPTVNNSGYNAVYDTTQAALDSNHTWEGVEGYNQETKKITRKLSLTVNKAIPRAEAPTELTATYGDTLSNVHLSEGWSWENPSQSVGDAGEHLFRAIYNPDSDNYNDLSTTLSVTVNKANPNVTAPGAITDITYTGLANDLVTEGNADGGTLVYSIGGTYYSTVIPQGVDAGNYTVYYKVEEDGNYNGTEPQEIPVTIQKAEFDITVSIADWVLGSEEGPQPMVSGNISGGEITYEYKQKDAGEEAYSTDRPTSDAEYTVRATVAATQNYVSASATADFMVSQPSNKPVARSLIYNGSELELISGGDQSYEYSLDGEYYSHEIPKAKDSGVYKVYYKVEGSTVNELYVTIHPQPQTIATPSISDIVTYGTSLSEVTLPGGWAWEDGAIVPEVNNSGYKVVYTISYDPNYDWSAAEGYSADGDTIRITRLIKVIVGMAKPNVIPPAPKTLTYTGESQQLVTAGGGDGVMLYGLKTDLFGGIYLPARNIPTGVDAKTYTVYYQLAGDRNHSVSPVASVQVTILPKPAELETPQTETVVYGTKLSEIPLPEGWKWSDGATVPQVTNSGYEAEYTVTPNSNYTWADVAGYDSSTRKVTRTIPVTVTKAASTPKIPTELTAEYGQKLSDITLPDGWAWSNADESVGNAGTHTFEAVFTPKDTNNYLLYNADLTVEVGKATPIVTEPAVKDVTYNGEAQELVTAAETTGGTLLYSLDGENYFTAVPNARNAGKYTVYYKVEDDANYYGIDAAMVEVNIAKAAITPTVSMPDWTIGGTAPEPVLTGNIGGGEVKYEYKLKNAEDSEYSEAKPVDDGNYTIRATVNETANYNGASVTADFTVLKAAGAPAARYLTYDGSAQKLVTAENDGFVYSLDGKDYSSDIPTGTNAGKYTVYYKIGQSSAKTLETLILPAEVKLIVPEITEGVTYGARLSEIELSEGWTWADGSILPDVSNTLGYEAIYTVSDYKNYDWGSVEGYDKETHTVARLIKINVTKANVSVQPPTAKTLTYTSESQQLVNQGSADGGIMLYSLDNDTFTANIPTGTNAGNYTVYFKVTGDGNHNDSEVNSVYVTILPKAATLETPQAEAVVYGKALSEIPLSEGWSWKNGETIPTVTNLGYEAEYAVTYDSNYTWEDIDGYDSSTSTVTRTIPVTVTKAASTPEIPSALTAEYGQKLSEITLPDDWAWSNADESVGNAGTHTFEAVFTPKDTNNYSLYYADLTVEVDKATPTVTEPTAIDLTYNGEAHELVSAAQTNGGTLLYSLDGENYFTAVPKARNAGNYTVYYKVEDDANYYGIDAATVEANIAKAAITPTVSMPEWTVGGAAPEPVLTGNIGGGDVTYEYKAKDAEDSTYSEVKPVDAGNYTIRATVAATTNYNEAIITADFTVFKAAGAPVARYLTYDGRAQKLVTAENDGFVYSLDGETFNSEIPEETNAGTYTVYFKIGQSSVQTLDVTIAPAMPELNIPETTGSFVYGKHLYEIPLTEGWTWADGNIVPDVNNHGYEAVYSIRQDEEDESYKNYMWSNIEGYDEESLTVTRMVDLTVTKADAELTLPKVKMRTYTGAEQELVTAGSARGGQILYSLDNETYTTNIPMGVDANTYTVYYKVVGDSNHNDSEVSNLTVTIFPKDAELTEPSTASVTYGTKLSDIELPEGWEWSDKNTVPTVTNSGYAAKYIVTENPNYTWERISGYDSETGTVTRTLPVTVNKANEAPEIPSSLTATYGDTLSAVSLPEGWAWKNGDTNVGSAGTHAFTAVYTPSDTDNYESLEREVAITVEKALPEMTEPETKTLIYTGANQELITASESMDGTVLYSLNGVTYSTAVPSGKNAGEYKVYYKVKGDENHLDSEPETVNAAIEKADIQLEVNMLSRSMDEEPSNPMVYGNTGNGTVTYKYKPKNSADSAYSEAMPNTQGVYKVSATAAETDNYNSATAETEFVILPSWSSREYSLMFIDSTLLITAPHSGPCTVIFAAYKNGVLQNVYTEEKIFEGEGMDIAVMPEELTAGEPDEIRAMLWSSLTDMVPLCSPEIWQGQ